MKASEQLVSWISDDNDLFGTSQDEILKLVFQFPAVASYKLMLAKWQFLRHGAVEEGLWQQLLLQWPNPAQLFEWRSKSFDFNKVEETATYQSPELIELLSEEIPTHDQPIEGVWNWEHYLNKMQSPISFVWEIPQAVEIVEIEELPVFEFLLQTESAHDAIPEIEEFKITEDLPIKKEATNIVSKPWEWATYINENLDHISSVWISENLITIHQTEEIPLSKTEEIVKDAGEVLQVIVPDLEKNEFISVQSSAMDSSGEFKPSAFVQWLHNQKQLQITEEILKSKDKGVSETEVIEEEVEKEVEKEKDQKKPKQEKKIGKEKNKEKDKHKKKDKKKKKHKKKDKLEEEIFSSLEFSDDVASETYAALLAKQGHHELSERIYERLRLIYPEKSSYFAGLIKKLKS